ncbi:MAG: PorV/PorQ family protein [candidate division Zixibacteria bacterium]|nr:PorV/PorQ family protein [candidate division Zixibacteria bacterium]
MKKTISLGIIVIVVSLLVWSESFAINSKVGTTAYAFLKIDVSARSTAMGGAFVGLSDDESALYFNPAGLIQIEQKSFFTTYINYLADIQSGFLGYVHPYSENTRLGVSVYYFNYGSLTQTSKRGEVLGTFGAGDFALALSFVRSVNSQISFGATGKFIYEKIESYSSDALALDLGIIHISKDARTRFGLVGQNLGAQLKGFTRSHKDDLPIAVKVGMSHHMRELPLTVALDAAKPFDNDIFFNLGGEFTALKPLYLRVGWSSFGENFKTDSDKDDLAGFAGGFGVRWKAYRFDYAYSSYADLGGVHKISISGGI